MTLKTGKHRPHWPTQKQLLLSGNYDGRDLGQNKVYDQADHQNHNSVDSCQHLNTAIRCDPVFSKQARHTEEENKSRYHAQDRHGLSAFESKNGEHKGLDTYKYKRHTQNDQVKVEQIPLTRGEHLKRWTQQMTDQNTDYAGKKSQERKQKTKQKMSFLMFSRECGKHLQKSYLCGRLHGAGQGGKNNTGKYAVTQDVQGRSIRLCQEDNDDQQRKQSDPFEIADAQKIYFGKVKNASHINVSFP